MIPKPLDKLSDCRFPDPVFQEKTKRQQKLQHHPAHQAHDCLLTKIHQRPIFTNIVLESLGPGFSDIFNTKTLERKTKIRTGYTLED